MSPIAIGFKMNSAGWDKCDGERSATRPIVDKIAGKISIWNRLGGDARGFRQDLRGSIDCRGDALFARRYRWPYRAMT